MRSSVALGRDLGRDGIPNAPQRWQDTEKGERSSIDHFLPIDQYRQLAVASLDELRFNAQFLTQEGRRTDGLDARDSVAAATNRHQHGLT